MSSRHSPRRATARHSAGPSGASVERISGPAELVQAVPYMLGFHPHQSLVLVGLDRGTLVVTARLDLPESVDDLEGGFLGVLADTVGVLQRASACEVIAAVYAAHGTDPELIAGAVALLVDAVGLHGSQVLDALLVTGDSWRSLLCADRGCCGTESPLPTSTSAFAAAATVAGVVPLPGREHLEALLEQRPRPERDALEPLLADAEHSAVQSVLDGCRTRHDRSVVRALFAAARACAAHDWPAPDDATVARFGAALAEIALRDKVWMGVDDGRIDGRALWRDLAARLPAPYDAAPLFLYGWASWRAGDGALASIAVERALAADPGYSAADLLGAALSRGVDPRRLPRLRLPRTA